MGRIDDALRRSDLDVGRGTGVPAPAPGFSPWQFEPHEGRRTPEPAAILATPVSRVPVVEVRTERPVPGDDGRLTRSGAFDAGVMERLVVASTARPLHIEQFRSLAATLHQAQNEQQVKSLIVTSPSPGDGKSHVAVNLALTLSHSYQRRVLLVDADLRRPTLHLVFRVLNTRGLSEALKAESDEKVQAVQVGETLTLLPAGRPDRSPLAGLSSDRMKRIVADAAAHFDWVIVDSPPVGVLADGRLVSETVDAALLVVRAGVTRFPDLEAAVDTIGRERILGIVLNAVDAVEIRGEGYYHHYYGDDPN